MTATTNVFESKFGFHACDRETYKKIKRIRHLIEQCKGRNNRFNWFWRKAPQNRVIKTYTGERNCTMSPMSEPKLFDMFYRKSESKMSKAQMEVCGYHPEQFRYKVEPTLELDLFMQTYKAARHPFPTAEAVKPMLHTVEEIDLILHSLEDYLNA